MECSRKLKCRESADGFLRMLFNVLLDNCQGVLGFLVFKDRGRNCGEKTVF